MNRSQKLKTILLFALIVVTAGCSFPIYNFTKSFGKATTVSILFINVSCYGALGAMERPFVKNWKVHQVALLNWGMILLSMLFRYLLEFGEVSNTYNFTAPNIALHIVATLTISMVSYLTAREPVEQD